VEGRARRGAAGAAGGLIWPRLGPLWAAFGRIGTHSGAVWAPWAPWAAHGGHLGERMAARVAAARRGARGCVVRGVGPARRRIGPPRRAVDGRPARLGEFVLRERPSAVWGAAPAAVAAGCCGAGAWEPSHRGIVQREGRISTRPRETRGNRGGRRREVARRRGAGAANLTPPGPGPLRRPPAGPRHSPASPHGGEGRAGGHRGGGSRRPVGRGMPRPYAAIRSFWPHVIPGSRIRPCAAARESGTCERMFYICGAAGIWKSAA